jgi:DNA-binding transcriptional MerR regulator
MANKAGTLMLWREANSLLTLEDLADAAAMPPKRVEKLVGAGLLEPSSTTCSGPLFPASCVERLRRIRRLRRDLGINLPGIAAVLDMRERIESLQQETQWLRRQLGFRKPSEMRRWALS